MDVVLTLLGVLARMTSTPAILSPDKITLRFCNRFSLNGEQMSAYYPEIKLVLAVQRKK